MPIGCCDFQGWDTFSFEWFLLGSRPTCSHGLFREFVYRLTTLLLSQLRARCHFKIFVSIPDAHCSRKKALAFFAAVEKNRCPKKIQSVVVRVRQWAFASSSLLPLLFECRLEISTTDGRADDGRRGGEAHSSGHFHSIRTPRRPDVVRVASVTRLPRLPRLPERRDAVADGGGRGGRMRCEWGFDDAAPYSVDGFRVRRPPSVRCATRRP